MSVRFEMRLPDDLAERIDEARGNETRASWIKRALGAALAGGGSDGESKAARAALPVSTPRRASFTDAQTHVPTSPEALAARLTREAAERRRLRDGR